MFHHSHFAPESVAKQHKASDCVALVCDSKHHSMTLSRSTPSRGEDRKYGLTLSQLRNQDRSFLYLYQYCVFIVIIKAIINLQHLSLYLSLLVLFFSTDSVCDPSMFVRFFLSLHLSLSFSFPKIFFFFFFGSATQHREKEKSERKERR